MKTNTIKAKSNRLKKDNTIYMESAIKRLQYVLIDAREFIAGCKNDLELFSFLRKYEKIKFKKRRLRVKVRKAINNFIYSFPSYWQIRIKRYTDLVLTSCAFLISAPLMAIIAIAVKATSKGPVLYKQERVGKNGRHFIMYKFRSMYCNAESNTGPVWAQIENDPRVTPIGSFLRKTHLDELPQLFNVLNDDMSVVGPRPERPYFVSKLKKSIPHYVQRLDVKPGITGLAQVKQKYDETIADVKKKLKYDLVYVRKMCLTLDLKVLIWTIGVIISGKIIR